MKARLRKFWNLLHSNYWFVPSVMALAAILLAWATIQLDEGLQERGIGGLAERLPFPFRVRPDAARSLLSTIAGTMITVGALAFSITISAVVHASSSYGPRLLGRFMRDRGNQVTLGTYIATFLYSLLVLIRVESAEEGVGTGAGFVPHVSVLISVVLTFASIGVLIYFLNHAPQSIHVSNVIGELGGQLRDRVRKVFPERLGASGDASTPENDALRAIQEGQVEGGWPVRAARAGFLQVIEGESLIRAARRHDLVVRLDFRPGDFADAGDTLLYACPASELDEEQRAEASADLLDCMAFGMRRTLNQDVRLPVDQLVEVAVRALSPGINDPFTANDCMDALGRGIHAAAQRGSPDRFRFDEDQRLRVITDSISLAELIERAFGRPRPYVAGDAIAAGHVLSVLGRTMLKAPDSMIRELLLGEAGLLLQVAERKLDDPVALPLLQERLAVLSRIGQDEDDRARFGLEYDWLGGSG